MKREEIENDLKDKIGLSGDGKFETHLRQELSDYIQKLLVKQENRISDDLYDLELHDQLKLKLFLITRVPGGWIYTRQEPLVNIANHVFVPFDNEFKGR